jgi:VIT1/CCC1 family predicted Fe2+/Mn2+ transporter
MVALEQGTPHPLASAAVSVVLALLALAGTGFLLLSVAL